MVAFDSLSFEQNFEAAVTYALKAIGGKMIWCYKRRSGGMQWQLFIAVRICFYGCQLVLESLCESHCVMKAYLSCLILNWVVLLSVIIVQ